VSIIGECRDRNVSDVVGIDKGFRHRTNGKSQLAREDRVQKEVLTEVLAEEAAAQNGPLRTTGFQRILHVKGLNFSSAGQKNDFSDAEIFSFHLSFFHLCDSFNQDALINRSLFSVLSDLLVGIAEIPVLRFLHAWKPCDHRAFNLITLKNFKCSISNQQLNGVLSTKTSSLRELANLCLANYFGWS